MAETENTTSHYLEEEKLAEKYARFWLDSTEIQPSRPCSFARYSARSAIVTTCSQATCSRSSR